MPAFDTPWKGMSINKHPSRDLVARNRAARKAMSRMELECGITDAEYTEIHRSQRERVLRRYGLTP